MARRVVTDDSHPSINYTGSWVSEGPVDSISNEYNGTVHKTTTGGSSLSFHFQGDRMTVFATLVNISTGLPRVTLSIDNDTPRVLNETGNIKPRSNYTLWSHCQVFLVINLADDRHTATLSVEEASEEHPFYFDFYSARNADWGGTVIVDDHDGYVAYTGDWVGEGIIEEYNHTAQRSPSLPGGTATLKFNGTSVRVYGAVKNEPWDILSFTLDSNSSSRTTFTGSSDKEYGWNSLLYQVDGLAPTVHRLVVTNLNSTPLYLDYFTYDSVGPPLDAHVVDPPTVSNQPGIGGTSNQNPIPTKKPATGAIVGGVLGGIALVLLIGALFYYRRRRSIIQVGHFEPKMKGITVHPFTSLPNASAPRRPRRPRKGELAVSAGLASENVLMHNASGRDDADGSIINGSGYPPILGPSEGEPIPLTSQRDQPVFPAAARTAKTPAGRTSVPRNIEQVAEVVSRPAPRPTTNPGSSQLISPPPAYHD
ncbi:hypothetical protein CPB86DRAFT_177030 [Serendipita vermifera]|nr:hypothetical protein CPB86DRAFT_177030 [Serendipita vermifera]